HRVEHGKEDDTGSDIEGRWLLQRQCIDLIGRTTGMRNETCKACNQAPDRSLHDIVRRGALRALRAMSTVTPRPSERGSGAGSQLPAPVTSPKTSTARPSAPSHRQGHPWPAPPA